MQLLSEGQHALLTWGPGGPGGPLSRKVPEEKFLEFPGSPVSPLGPGIPTGPGGPFHANLNEENSINTASSGVSLAWGLKRNCFSVGTGQGKELHSSEPDIVHKSDRMAAQSSEGHCPLSYDPSHLSSIALIDFMTVSQI